MSETPIMSKEQIEALLPRNEIEQWQMLFNDKNECTSAVSRAGFAALALIASLESQVSKWKAKALEWKQRAEQAETEEKGHGNALLHAYLWQDKMQAAVDAARDVVRYNTWVPGPDDAVAVPAIYVQRLADALSSIDQEEPGESPPSLTIHQCFSCYADLRTEPHKSHCAASSIDTGEE